MMKLSNIYDSVKTNAARFMDGMKSLTNAERILR